MPTFRQLHFETEPLVLPNAWDLGSALAFADAGYAAVGTTSFGVAASAGSPDGAGSSKAATLALAAGMCQLPVHVTVDVEDGYSDDPSEVAKLVATLAATGVAGVNLEDSADGRLVSAASVSRKIAAIKSHSPEMFVNARVDNFWFGEQATVAEVVERARSYADAGADGIFVPGVSAAEDIQALAAGIELPLNVLAHPTLTVPELGRLGVRRVSSGSLPYRAAVDAAVESVNALRAGGQTPAATPYWQMQKRLSAFRESSAG